jgi:hypothetical protein
LRPRAFILTGKEDSKSGGHEKEDKYKLDEIMPRAL